MTRGRLALKPLLSYLRKHAPAVRAGWPHVKAALDASNERVRRGRLQRKADSDVGLLSADEPEAGGHDEL